jgi:hypothetical protein
LLLANKLFSSEKIEKRMWKFINFENHLYISKKNWRKIGQGRWHLPLKSVMFLETVNKNTPGELCFKVIENIWFFLPNANIQINHISKEITILVLCIVILDKMNLPQKYA